jgi:hypothetical protein
MALCSLYNGYRRKKTGQGAGHGVLSVIRLHLGDFIRHVERLFRLAN